MKESDLYEPVREYFEEQGYEVFAEVVVPFSGGRVDAIAYTYPAAIAIEFKTSLTIGLIEQVMERKNVFPLIYIAIPLRRGEIASWLIRFLKAEGIGILQVDAFGEVVKVMNARYRKPYLERRLSFEKILKEEHRTWVPGGHAGGGYVTDYRITMKGVRSYLSTQRKLDRFAQNALQTSGVEHTVVDGWRTVKEILAHCETHYATPKNSLAKSLLNFESDWVESKKEKGRLYFRHKQ